MTQILHNHPNILLVLGHWDWGTSFPKQEWDSDIRVEKWIQSHSNGDTKSDSQKNVADIS